MVMQRFAESPHSWKGHRCDSVSLQWIGGLYSLGSAQQPCHNLYLFAQALGLLILSRRLFCSSGMGDAGGSNLLRSNC